jgi:hypothetical protein
MLDGTPRHVAVALLALALHGCGGDDTRSYDEDDETETEPSSNDRRDAAGSEADDDAPLGDDDDGREVDAARRDPEPTRPRDAATPSADARAPQADASVPAEPAVDAGRSDAGEARDAGDGGRDAAGAPRSDAGAPPLTPTYHIALRVHRADSGLSGAAIAAALEEMNQIWWKQAAICFEVEVVRSEEVRRDGFDLWFHRSRLGCGAMANGVYCGDHDVHTLDAPSLNAADNAAWDTRLNPARTSAHELGHGLSLEHYNGFPDSNDSLMSSGRQGFKLHESEITMARRRAQTKAIAGAPATPCPAVPVVD